MTWVLYLIILCAMLSIAYGVWTTKAVLASDPGTARMGRSLLARLGAVLAQGAFRALKEKLDPRQLNGGIFLGLNGIVIKSHGGTDATGFASAIDLAYDMASNGVVKRLASDVAGFHAKLELEGAA